MTQILVAMNSVYLTEFSTAELYAAKTNSKIPHMWGKLETLESGCWRLKSGEFFKFSILRLPPYHSDSILSAFLKFFDPARFRALLQVAYVTTTRILRRHCSRRTHQASEGSHQRQLACPPPASHFFAILPVAAFVSSHFASAAALVPRTLLPSPLAALHLLLLPVMMSSSAFIGSTMTHLRGLGLGSTP